MTQQQQAPENVVSHKHKRSLGENIFDSGLYTGVGFALNTALSIWLTFQLEKHHPEVFKNMGKHFGKAMESLGAGEGAGMAQFGETMSKNLTLLSGGFAVLPLIKWTEDAKKPIIRGMDKVLGTTPDPVMDEHGNMVDSLDLAPKQNWMSMLSGRAASIFVGYVPLAAMVKALPSYHVPLTNYMEPLIEKSPKWMPKGRAFSETVSMEFISSAITTASLYAVSRFVAWWQDQKDKGQSPHLVGAMQVSKPEVKSYPAHKHVPSAAQHEQEEPQPEREKEADASRPTTHVAQVAEHAALQETSKQIEYA